MSPLLVAFVAGSTGPWEIARVNAVLGDPLPVAERIKVLEGGEASRPLEASWLLRGVTSNERYVNRNERRALSAREAPLGRPEATCAALIPITKSEAWWALTREERREIFEERRDTSRPDWSTSLGSHAGFTTGETGASRSTF